MFLVNRNDLFVFIGSTGVSIRICFETITSQMQHGCHVMAYLKSIGEEQHHAGTATALVVKQVSNLIFLF